tara:strand:- start:782 stop:1843 length:1062 start_codon:yes stop_codon:yes gene_type:complete
MFKNIKTASEIAILLGQQAEAVCQHYLSNGHRAGNYWIIGNILNEKGRSMYVRLSGAPSGYQVAGKWTDAATGQHGDLLDLIHLQGNYNMLREAIEEAHRFLALPRPEYFRPVPKKSAAIRTDREVITAARRLFNAARPIGETIAETYLAGRGIIVPDQTALRFHPKVYYRDDDGNRSAHPALLAAVHDNDGKFMAVNRIWIDRMGNGLAHIPTPKKALGHLLGNAVRFGHPRDILIVGEGVETILSLKCARPDLAMAAALSANHLAAFIPPSYIKQLIIARDNDEAGEKAASVLAERVCTDGITCHKFVPHGKDFNDDLKQFGKKYLADRLTEFLAEIDGTILPSSGSKSVG